MESITLPTGLCISMKIQQNGFLILLLQPEHFTTEHTWMDPVHSFLKEYLIFHAP